MNVAAPDAIYRARLAERQAAIAGEDRRFRALGNARLAVVVLAVALAWLVFARHAATPWFLALPAAVLLALIAWHERVERARQRARRAALFYERGLSRCADRWTGEGEPGERFRAPHHPYAEDLDLFGRGSLFERLCTARTRRGEETLAAWLCAPAALDEVRARQRAVDALRDRLDLREELFLAGDHVRAGVDTAALTRWAEAPPAGFPAVARPLALACAGVNLAAVALLAAGAGSWVLVALFAGGSVGLAFRRRVGSVLGAVDRPLADLRVLAEVLELIERERADAPKLAALAEALRSGGVSAAGAIGRLARLSDLVDARRNQFFAPIAALLFWGTLGALAIERWRRVHGRAVARWLDAAGEFEALGALAAYAFERPEDPFPVLEDGGGRPRLAGEALGHPLLPGASCVRNDVRLGGEAPRLYVVSGSNMSGKSTLLRTVGVNVVLALAGAPVRAKTMTLTPLAIGATLRVQDSLAEGASRFYAEITRLAQIVALASGPALFLLDEILAGTNSHDRRIGAEAIVRGLTDRGAIGLVTTHDLALAAIAESLGAAAVNVHFEDHLEDGAMRFDYRMRPGVVTKSNALALMRAVGLEV